MSVKRYEANGSSSVFEDASGSLVEYEDHAALEQKLTELAVELANAESKCRELAAENENARNAVQVFCDVVGANTDAICEEVGQDGVRTILAAMNATGNMPATDAFLAEVRAQGVDAAINTVIAMMNHQHPVTSKAIDILRVHAAQIRKGAAL